MVRTGRLGQRLYGLQNDYDIATNFFSPTDIEKETYTTEIITPERLRHKKTNQRNTTPNKKNL